MCPRRDSCGACAGPPSALIRRLPKPRSERGGGGIFVMRVPHRRVPLFAVCGGRHVRVGVLPTPAPVRLLPMFAVRRVPAPKGGRRIAQTVNNAINAHAVVEICCA